MINAKELLMLLEERQVGIEEISLNLTYDKEGGRYLVNDIDETRALEQSKDWPKLKKLLESLKELHLRCEVTYFREDGFEGETIRVSRIKGQYQKYGEIETFDLTPLLENRNFMKMLIKKIYN